MHSHLAQAVEAGDVKEMEQLLRKPVSEHLKGNNYKYLGLM